MALAMAWPWAGPSRQRAEDEQVERALEHFDAVEFVFSRHSRWRIMSVHLECQGEQFITTAILG